MEEFLRFLDRRAHNEAPGEDPPLPDGSRERILPETWPRPLYSQDSAQEEPSTPQGGGLIVVKVEDGQEAPVRGEEPCANEEVSTQVSPEPINFTVRKYRLEEDGQLVVTEEQTLVQINGGEPKDCVVRNFKVEDNGQVDIKEEQPFLPNGTEPSDLVVRICKVGEELDIKEEQTFMPISTEHSDLVTWNFKVEEDEELDIKQEKMIMQISPDEQQYREYKEEKPPHLSTDDHMDYDITPYIDPELSSEGVPTSLHGVTHPVSHSEVETFTCPQCGECLTERTRLLSCCVVQQAHMCPSCGDTFDERAKPINCRISHKTSKPRCEQRVSDGCFLSRHKMTHTEEPLTCFACGPTFSKECFLLDHPYSYRDKNPQSGNPVCEGSEDRPAGDYKPNLVHQQKEEPAAPDPFCCLKCGRNFVNKMGLRGHRCRAALTGHKSDLVGHHKEIPSPTIFWALPAEPKDAKMATSGVGEDAKDNLKGETLTQMKTEPADLLVSNYKIEEDRWEDVKENHACTQRGTDTTDDLTVRRCKVEDDGRVVIREEQTFMLISTDGQQYRAPSTEERPRLSSDDKIEDDVACDPFKENIKPESSFGWIPPEQLHAGSHLVPQSELEVFPCPQCGECFPKRAELLSHLSRHEVEQVYVCFSCGESFDERAKLLVHIASHKSSKPHLCFRCGQHFSDEGALSQHKKTHEEERHTCPVCGLSFPREFHLLNHLRSHRRKNCQSGNGELTSEYFSYSERCVYFDRKLGPLSQKTKRVVVRSFHCLNCGRSFWSKKGVRRHRCTAPFQTEEWKCVECEKTFLSQDCLLYHKMKQGGGTGS